MKWKPPAGTEVVHSLPKAQPCRLCHRPLQRGETVLGWTRTRGKPRSFRCVDAEDCASVISYGGWPDAQPRLEAYAARLDRERAKAGA